MKNFILPGFNEKFHINKQVINLYETLPEIFVDNFNIGAIFGNIGFNIWEGGRIFVNPSRQYKEDIIFLRNYYDSKNIPIRLTFTNCLIEEQHLYDSYCNMIAELFQTGNNEILVSSSLLETYLREKYPNYKYCSSTTKCLTNKQEAKSELEKYYEVCLDYNLNHNTKFLESLSQEEKDKTEFLCNAICPSGCPNRKKHYDLNSRYVLNAGKHYNIQCSIDKCVMHPDTLKYPNNISPNEIEEYYEPLGFKNFKLEGRTLQDSAVLGSYTHYLIKPEHRGTFIGLMNNIEVK